MAVMIDGKAVSARLRQKMAAEVAAMKEAGVVPGLAVVLASIRASPSSEESSRVPSPMGRLLPLFFSLANSASTWAIRSRLSSVSAKRTKVSGAFRRRSS